MFGGWSIGFRYSAPAPPLCGLLSSIGYLSCAKNSPRVDESEHLWSTRGFRMGVAIVHSGVAERGRVEKSEVMFKIDGLFMFSKITHPPSKLKLHRRISKRGDDLCKVFPEI